MKGRRSRLDVGIVGCGAVSSAHVQAYLKRSDACRIVGVADPNPELARKAAEAAGADCAVYDDYRQLLARGDIDVVSVCTPPALHREMTVAAFESGAHVLCEKPLAPTLADCDAMLEAAERTGKKLAAAMQYRYRRDYLQVKRIVDAGLLGKPVFARLDAAYWRDAEYFRQGNKGTWAKEGGGVVMTQAIHPIDALGMILGEAESVDAELDTLVHDIEAEDTAVIRLRFRNGARAVVTACTHAPGQRIEMTVWGERRSVSVPLAFDAVTASDTGFPRSDEEGLSALTEAAASPLTASHPFRTQDDDSHDGPVSDLLDSIAGGREPWMNGREARRSLELVTAIYKSGFTGERVMLPLAADDPWYRFGGRAVRA